MYIVYIIFFIFIIMILKNNRTITKSNPMSFILHISDGKRIAFKVEVTSNNMYIITAEQQHGDAEVLVQIGETHFCVVPITPPRPRSAKGHFLE